MNRFLVIMTSIAACAAPLFSGVIASQTFGFGDSSGTQATVTTTVLDNYHGDTSREDWIYTLTNLSYLRSYPLPLGLMALGYLPTYYDETVSMLTGSYVPPDPYIIDNIAGPWPFCRAGCDMQGAWATTTTPGLVPGQSSTFEFSVYAPPGWSINVQTGSAFVSAYLPTLAAGPFDPITGVMYVPSLTDSPEPGTWLLGLFGVGSILASSWFRRQPHSIRLCFSTRLDKF